MRPLSAILCALGFLVLGLCACTDGGASDAKDTTTIADTNSGTAQSQLVVGGEAPAVAENKTVVAQLVASDGTRIATQSGTVHDGSYQLTLAVDVRTVSGGNVAVYVDINGDSVCDIAPTDIGGMVATSDTGEVTLALTSASQPPCGAFGDHSLVISGNDFTPHNNQTIYAALKDTQSDAYVTQPKGAVVVSGVWTQSFAGVMVQNRSYTLEYFADIAGDKQCQDHSWQRSIAAVTQDVAVEVSHDAAMTAICSDFPAIPTGP